MHHRPNMSSPLSPLFCSPPCSLLALETPFQTVHHLTFSSREHLKNAYFSRPQLQEPHEDEFNALNRDFARLRESIRAELGYETMVPARQPEHSCMPPAPETVSQSQPIQPMSAAPSHLTHAAAPSPIESVFYAVHDSLLSGVVSHYDNDPPPVPETENRTVLQRIKFPPTDCTEPSGRGGEHEGGREASAALDTCEESSLASQFESLRASIASQLQRTPAASPPVFFKPDDAGYPPVLLREASDSMCALQAEAIEERAAPTLTIDRPTVCTSAEENTVLINARKPACEPNPAAANASDAGRLASGNARQAVKGKLKKTPKSALSPNDEARSTVL